jgi:hypothetical protein
MPINVFLSVGTPFTGPQEEFVSSVEAYLLKRGLKTQTVGRNNFPDRPLHGVRQLMKCSAGAVIIAFERIRIENGVEKRGSVDQTKLAEVDVATPWNQIEAAFAYAMNLPLLVMKERSVRSDGLLEGKYDWFVQEGRLTPAFLTSLEFKTRCDRWARQVRWRALRKGWVGVRSVRTG